MVAGLGLVHQRPGQELRQVAAHRVLVEPGRQVRPGRCPRGRPFPAGPGRCRRRPTRTGLAPDRSGAVHRRARPARHPGHPRAVPAAPAPGRPSPPSRDRPARRPARTHVRRPRWPRPAAGCGQALGMQHLGPGQERIPPLALRVTAVLRSAASRAGCTCPASSSDRASIPCDHASWRARPALRAVTADFRQQFRRLGVPPAVSLVHSLDGEDPGQQGQDHRTLAGRPRPAPGQRRCARPACTSAKASSRRMSAARAGRSAVRAASNARCSTTAPSPSDPRTACTRAPPRARSTSA